MFGSRISIFILLFLWSFGQNACYEVSGAQDTLTSGGDLVGITRMGTSIFITGADFDNGYGLLHQLDNSLNLLKSYMIYGKPVSLYRSIVTNDGNLAIWGGGVSDTFDFGCVLKISPTGNLIWSKLINIGDKDFYPMGFAMLKDGSYILAGYRDFNANFEGVILHIGSQGQLLWAKKVLMEDTIHTQINGVTATSDGNFFITGEATNATDHIIYGFIAKMSPTGNFIWKKRITFHTSDVSGISVAEAPDKSIIVSGIVDSVAPDSYQDIFIMRINSSGQKLWSKSFTINKDAYGGSYEWYSYIKLLGNEILIIGNTDFGATNYIVTGILLKVDMQGNLQWNKIVKSAGLLGDCISYNNGVLTVGMSQNLTQYLLQYNANSSICSGCGVETQGHFSDININIQNLTKYSMTNFSPSIMNLPLSVSTANYKINNGCNLFSGISKKTLSLKVYPTITSGQITIEDAPTGKIFIYNSLGQKVVKQNNIRKKTLLDLTGMPAGIYLLRFISKDNRVFTTKIIKK